MRWERFFDDLEAQLDAEREAGEASLRAETRRADIAAATLADRLRAAVSRHQALTLTVADVRVDGTAAGIGADWIAIAARDALHVVRLAALDMVLDRLPPPPEEPASPLVSRLTFGYLLRDLARRRVRVRVDLIGGRTLPGTIDRAGVDHLDLALHDGDARRDSAVTGYRTVPFRAVAVVRADVSVRLPFG